MEKLFQKKYRVASARLRSWDYSQDSYYFVTICTRDKKKFFGVIRDKKIILSPLGEIAENFWQQIPEHFPFVRLDKSVVMPNHLHGIVIIDKWGCGENSGKGRRDAKFCVSTCAQNKFGPQSKNLASIIRGFKAGVKKYATMHDLDFTWQSRYYDRVIRDENELNRIQDYILTNVANWEKDKDNLETNFCQ
ncbi:MAG: hypothetical protein V1936_03610 [Patescibacteria group bacterium]